MVGIGEVEEEAEGAEKVWGDREPGVSCAAVQSFDPKRRKERRRFGVIGSLESVVQPCSRAVV